MKYYFWRKRGFVLFLVLIVVLGYGALSRPPSYEIYPFYSWSMFSWVPSQEDGYALFILQQGEATFNPPIEFQFAGSRVANPNSVVAFRDIQNMGIAYTKGDMKRFEELRSLFERNYLRPNTHYQLVRTNSDPLTRWKTGKRTIEPLNDWVYTQ